MSLTWPHALPPLSIDIDVRFDDNTIRTEMDHGPTKKRRRYTAVSKKLSVRNWHLRGDDHETLVDFYEVQTRGGADVFTMPSPMSGIGSSQVRFDSPLRWEVVIPSENDGRRLVRVEFELEVLP